MVSVEIKRNKPVGFENISEIIKLEVPKARDLYGLDFSGENAMKSCSILISRISSLSLAEVEELDANEFLKLQNKINEFLL